MTTQPDPPSAPRRVVDAVLNLGAQQTHGSFTREVRIANGWIALTAVFAAIFAIIFAFMGAHAAAAATGAAATAYVIALGLASTGKHLLARYAFLCSSNLVIWFFTSYLGPGFGVETYFAVSAVQAFLLFSNDERRHSLLFAALPVVLAIQALLGIPQVIAPIDNMPLSMKQYLPVLSVAAAIAHTALGVYHLRGEVQRNDDALLRAQDQLIRSNTELEQFAFIASHDLQEPLRTVKSFTELLEEECVDSLHGNAPLYLQFITQGATRMQVLVRSLLDYSRVGNESLHLETVAVADMVAALQHDLSAKTTETQALISTGPLHPVLADKHQLGQALMNLVSNALKFQRPGVRPTIHISTQHRGTDWLLSVADNGIGIEQRFADKVFKVFQRLHRRDEYSGTGIGLAVVKKVVDQHGGSIWFESEVGSGTTFFVKLPNRLQEESGFRTTA